jgi:hypothetical protein
MEQFDNNVATNCAQIQFQEEDPMHLIPRRSLILLHILPIWLFGSCCNIEWWSYTLLLSFAGLCGKRRSGAFRPQFKGAKAGGVEQGNGRWNWLAWEVWAKVNNLLQQIGQAGRGIPNHSVLQREHRCIATFPQTAQVGCSIISCHHAPF